MFGAYLASSSSDNSDNEGEGQSGRNTGQKNRRDGDHMGTR